MSVENTRVVMTRYFEAEHGDTSMLAGDVVFTIMATGEEHKGREGILDMLNYFYSVAFDARAESYNVVYGENGAVLEARLIGKHIGEFAGIPATGEEVDVPICVSYDVEGDQIKRGRVYFEIPALMTQLGIEMGPG
jgi:predicted ester cyclase